LLHIVHVDSAACHISVRFLSKVSVVYHWVEGWTSLNPFWENICHSTFGAILCVSDWACANCQISGWSVVGSYRDAAWCPWYNPCSNRLLMVLLMLLCTPCFCREWWRSFHTCWCSGCRQARECCTVSFALWQEGHSCWVDRLLTWYQSWSSSHSWMNLVRNHCLDCLNLVSVSWNVGRWMCWSGSCEQLNLLQRY